MMTKEQIFDEFKIVKEKDLKKKTKDGKESYTHRIALLQSHAEAKSAHPNQYRHLDINFDRLILAYQSPVPVDHFYKIGFGKTLAEYEHDKRLAELTEKQKEREEEKRLKEKEDVEKVTIN